LTGLSVSECHFGNFDIGVCEAVLEAINEVEIGLREGPQYKPSGMTSEQRARRIERETRVAAEIHDHWWSQ